MSVCCALTKDPRVVMDAHPHPLQFDLKMACHVRLLAAVHMTQLL